MSDYYRRRRRSDWPFHCMFFGFLFLLFGVGLAVHMNGRLGDDADMTRCLELRAVHARGIADIAENPNRQDRRQIEDRVRRAAAEHNVILAKHPTWTLPRLDTSELNR